MLIMHAGGPANQDQSMSIATAIAIYFIIWWMVLFAVLPWGVRGQHESGAVTPGTDPGAPAIPMLKRKLIWTTLDRRRGLCNLARALQLSPDHAR